jgi:glycine betaine/choline ABC-type transport system substrate-binding protein
MRGARIVVANVNKDLAAEAIQELNARVDLDKKTAEDVAGEYLSEPGLVQ